MAAERDAGWLAVSKLSNKAMKLYHAGHFARAADKQGDALAAARALGEEDCLVVASLAVHRAHSLAQHADGAGVSPAESDAAHEEAYVRLLPQAMQALTRRAAARTLLEGAVRPHELAWHRTHLAHLASSLAGHARDAWAEMAPHVGYSAFLYTAQLALNHLYYPNGSCAPATSGRDHELCMKFMCDALALMAAPRRSGGGSWIGAEAGFVASVRKLLADGGRVSADTALGARFIAAWQHLQRSGMLEQRQLLTNGVGEAARLHEEVTAAAASAAAAPERRTCALPSCSAQEAHVSHFKLCAACKTVVYCSKEHQAAHWPEHKRACKAAHAAAAAAAELQQHP
jgi:hypothetical protein